MKGLKTGGRKAGTPNRATAQRRQLIVAMTAANATPLEFLLAVMRCDSSLIDMKMRIDSARAILPFCHVRAGEAPAPGDNAEVISMSKLAAKIGWDKADQLRLEELRCKKAEQIEKWGDAAPWLFSGAEKELQDLEQRAAEDAERKALGLRNGAPDRKTQKMPFSTRRSFTSGTPRGLFGSNGLMAAHS
jgi:hypothetical protein